MDNRDIKTLIKILKHKRRADISNILEDSYSEIEESTQYGSYLFSALSTFLIFSPLEKFYKLKELGKEEQKMILDSILEIYPPAAYSPEITSVEYRILQNSDDTEKLKLTKVDKIKIFLSYSAKDKILAGKVKSYLESYGLELFLAHEDITPSAEWPKVILQNLESCNIFIPIITTNFKDSDWTDQEIGIALAKSRFIIPLSIDIIPYGFLNKLQSLKLDPNNILPSCEKLIGVIKKNSTFNGALLDVAIKNFLNSASFEEAGNKSQFLLEFDIYTSGQLKKTIEGSIQSFQIYESWSAQTNLRKLIGRYSKIIDKNLVEELYEKFSR